MKLSLWRLACVCVAIGVALAGCDPSPPADNGSPWHGSPPGQMAGMSPAPRLASSAAAIPVTAPTVPVVDDSEWISSRAEPVSLQPESRWGEAYPGERPVPTGMTIIARLGCVKRVDGRARWFMEAFNHGLLGWEGNIRVRLFSGDVLCDDFVVPLRYRCVGGLSADGYADSDAFPASMGGRVTRYQCWVSRAGFVPGTENDAVTPEKVRRLEREADQAIAEEAREKQNRADPDPSSAIGADNSSFNERAGSNALGGGDRAGVQTYEYGR